MMASMSRKGNCWDNVSGLLSTIVSRFPSVGTVILSKPWKTAIAILKSATGEAPAGATKTVTNAIEESEHGFLALGMAVELMKDHKKIEQTVSSTEPIYSEAAKLHQIVGAAAIRAGTGVVPFGAMGIVEEDEKFDPEELDSSTVYSYLSMLNVHIRPRWGKFLSRK